MKMNPEGIAKLIASYAAKIENPAVVDHLTKAIEEKVSPCITHYMADFLLYVHQEGKSL